MGVRAGESFVSPCALWRDGAGSAQGLRPRQGWRGSAWNRGLSAGGSPGQESHQLPGGRWSLAWGGTGCPCVTKAARGRLGVAPQEPVLAAGTAAGMRGSGQSWQLAGAAARWDRQAGVLAPGLHPGIPCAGTGSGRRTGWDVCGMAGGGLARPRERDGEAAAVPALRDPCRGGFTIGSCRTGTAPAGRAGWRWGGLVVVGPWHGPADPALAPVGRCSLTHLRALGCWAEPSLPLPSHGRRCGGDRL